MKQMSKNIHFTRNEIKRNDKNEKKHSYYPGIKRFFDILLSSAAIIILFPLLLLISIGIKLETRGPVLFKQLRVGRNKSLFQILKFRTMSIDAPKDTPTHLLDNSEKYITRTGKILRSTSFDELPQLLNILIGQMSIVGPRPALWNQYDLIEEREKYGINRINPGLTGWAQINGRDELSIIEKSNFDKEYIQRLGFKIDVICFFYTILSVVKRDGVVEGSKDIFVDEKHTAEKERC